MAAAAAFATAEAPLPAPLEPEAGAELAAWATMAALLTIELAAWRALLAKFGRDPLEDEDGGAMKEASGDEADAENRFEAKLAIPEAGLAAAAAGRVWM